MRIRRFLLIVLVLGGATKTAAQPLPPESVPGPLREWIPWALDGAEERRCPAVAEAAVCLWPGRLMLEASDSGAHFAIEAQADRAVEVALPGSERRWPLDVRLDGQAAAVLAREGVPVVRVTAGSHRIEGRFAWERSEA